MGTPAGSGLIRRTPRSAGAALPAALALALVHAASAADVTHFDGVQGPPAWANRVELSVRDSLQGRGIALWPTDSLQRLKDRNEWNGEERDVARIAALAKRTRATAVVWAKAETPVSTFERPWWSILWTRRHWTARADLYVADASGVPRIERLFVERREWLGFTGTNGADLWPVTEPERSRAEFALLAQLSGAIAAKVAGDSAVSAAP